MVGVARVHHHVSELVSGLNRVHHHVSDEMVGHGVHPLRTEFMMNSVRGPLTSCDLRVHHHV